MKNQVAIVLTAILLPVGPTWAQLIDVIPNQGTVQGSVQGKNDVTNSLLSTGLSLGLAALGSRQKIESRDANIPDATTTEIVFVLEGITIDPAETAAHANVTLVETVRLETVGLTMAVVSFGKGDDQAAAIARLSALPGLLWVQPNHLYQAMGNAMPLPPRFALHKVPAAPPTTTGTIALIDTNVALGHDALRGASLREERLMPKTAPGVHGTAIASLLVGTGQIPGTARGAQLVSFPAFVEQPKGPALSQTRYLARALDGAIRLHPNVLNLSFGGPEDRLLVQLLDMAQARGICVAAAAGNGGKSGTVPFPASHRASLAVTAVDDRLKLYGYATSGTRIDVAGVGVNLLAAVPKGYRAVSGTSFATAVVAGAAIRLPACRGSQGPSAFRTIVTAMAQDLGTPGRDTLFGSGFFQLAK
jgi:subtilisin family serine protease